VRHDAIIESRALLLPAAASIVAVWTLLALGSPLARVVGASAAVAITFSAATAIVLATSDSHRFEPGPAAIALGIALGFASYGVWITVIAWIGFAIGLEPRAPLAPTGVDVPLWLSMLLLAPIFEELLYRQRVLPALRPSIGTPAAILVSSALFAIPHLEAWSVLGTFLVGLALGTVFVATEAVGLCVALHAGLNLAALVSGSGRG
jgi:membrane protease YdiL (CAAX protease family)